MTRVTLNAAALPAAVALVAGSALAFELLLIRLLAITQHHIFAATVISVALLGFCASGTWLALTPARVYNIRQTALAWLAAGFGLSVPLAWWLAQRLPFEGSELLWDLWQLAWLGALYLVLAVPFLLAGLFLGAVFTRYPERIGSLYGLDLLGAGVGSVAMAILLNLGPAEQMIAVIALGGLLAAVLLKPAWVWAAPAVALLVTAALDWPEIELSRYKPLVQAEQTLGAQRIGELHSSRSRLTVLRNDQVPLRHVAGMSMLSPALPPRQLAVFVDGDRVSPIDAAAPRDYLQGSTDRLAFLLTEPQSVALVGETGGQHLAMAKHAGVDEIHIVQPEDNWRELAGQHSDFNGDLFATAQFHATSPRNWVARSGETLDLLLLIADPAGRHSLGDHALTREAFASYLDRADAVGVVSDISLPPRASMRLLTTAFAALGQLGVTQPADHVAAIRNWRRFVVLVAKSPITGEQITTARTFARRYAFDLVWYPNMPAEQANQRAVWPQAYLHQASAALARGEAAALVDRWRFDIRPTTDDRPLFDNFFRWGLLPELLESRQQAGLVLESSLLVLTGTLIVAIGAGLALLVPAAVVARRAGRARGFGAVAVYFSAIGLGFIIMEVAFLQRLTLLLGHPGLAAAFVLTSFLVFAGLGSVWGSKLLGRRPLRPAVLMLLTAALLDLALLGTLESAAIGWPIAGRLLLATAFTGPLAFAMGVPFPGGIRQFAAIDQALVPWAWAVNGAGSVVGGILAALLLLLFGFQTTVLVAIGCYALLLNPRLSAGHSAAA